MLQVNKTFIIILGVSLAGLISSLFIFNKNLTSSLFTHQQPNFLFIITDDQSWIHTSYAGYPAIQTPNFDRIAREGVYFENTFSSAPTCTASRSAILTGRHFWELGSAAQLWGEFPESLITYQQILEKHGYKVGYTGKGWGPGYAPQGNPAGANHDYNAARLAIDPNLTPIDPVENLKLFLAQREPDQPFSFWSSPTEPHRPYKQNIGRDSGTIPISLVDVPPFLPDAPEIRNDIADYLYEIQWFDAQLGQMLDLLKKEGLLNNTVIVYTSDNGMPFPRTKSNLYDYGTKVPLAVRWGDVMSGPRDVSDLISLIDIAPTFLELANISIPANMHGKSFVSQLLSKKSGQIDPSRNTVYTGFERHVATARLNRGGYPSRAIRTDQFLYIHNLAPERWPAGRPPLFDDIDAGSPTKEFLVQQRKKYEMRTMATTTKEGGMVITIDPIQSPYSIGRDPSKSLTLTAGKRPSEELYKVKTDPYQLNNLANDPAYAAIKTNLASKLAQEMKRTNDPRAMGTGAQFDTYKYYGIDKPDADKPNVIKN